MEANLTDREQDMFDMIVEHIKDHGVAPTVREIGGAFDMHVQAVARSLDALVFKGYLGRHPGVHRNLYVRLGNKCPCCGQAVKN